MVNQLSEKLAVWVLATIEPYVRPILHSIIKGFQSGQDLVTARPDQLAVFNDAYDTDPTHSMLAKDHFSVSRST